MTKSNSFQAGKKLESLSRKQKVAGGFAFGILIALLVFVLGVRPYQIRQERIRFESAKAELQIVLKELESEKLVKSISEDDSCGYSSAKFSKGSLYCGVGYTFKLIAPLKEVPLFEAMLAKHGYNKSTQSNYVSFERFSNSQIRCGIIVPTTNKSAGKLLLQCSSQSITEHFPVKI